ncbi:DUF262 domain-containing protein [Streptomonospora halophila]|uniref:DUF262 domain-containing protein n=1 Tax=Streptomonospora halophila TaxID=427369 RepID=A0ABP9G8M5_9ACTN
MAESPISGHGFTIEQLFSGQRFGLDYYQREYVWTRKHVGSLVEDLYQRFAASWHPEHSRSQTSEYAPYFLGPFVYFEEGETTYLVDGQQRITTLHLLLMHLRRLLVEQQIDADDDLSELDKLIRVSKHGRRTYTIAIDERSALLDSIYKGGPYTLPKNSTQSLRNLHERARDLDETFPPELRGESLLPFLDWLRDRVCLVGIKADSREQGWEIFKTMNDRGVKLDPIELLKGFLLSHGHDRHRLDVKWREMLAQIIANEPHTPSDFITAMLTAKFADLSETGPDSDTDRIGTAAHEWVRENHGRLSLHGKDSYDRFVTDEVCGLADRYASLLRAAKEPYEGREAVFYNAVNGLDWQYTAILAAVSPTDDLDEFWRKTVPIAGYLDLLYVRRFVNDRARQPEALDDEVAHLVPRLRDCRTGDDVRNLLSQEIAGLDDDFTGIAATKFGLRHDNRKQVRYLLARVTAWVEKECGKPDPIADYLRRQRPYEIEHIWADKPERYQSDAPTLAKFNALRDRLGALLLLDKSENASYRDAPLSEKVESYRQQNVLAASLHPEFHRARNPGFRKLRTNREYGLARLFQSYKNDSEFTAKAIDERQKLYQRLCELVWAPENYGFTVPKHVTPERRAARRGRARYDVTVAQLVRNGYLAAGQEIFGTRAGERYTATVLGDGHVKVDSGEIFTSVSSAAMFVLNRQSANGWTFWHAKKAGGKATLKSVRDEALKAGLRDQPALE